MLLPLDRTALRIQAKSRDWSCLKRCRKSREWAIIEQLSSRSNIIQKCRKILFWILIWAIWWILRMKFGNRISEAMWWSCRRSQRKWYSILSSIRFTWWGRPWGMWSRVITLKGCLSWMTFLLRISGRLSVGWLRTWKLSLWMSWRVIKTNLLGIRVTSIVCRKPDRVKVRLWGRRGCLFLLSTLVKFSSRKTRKSKRSKKTRKTPDLFSKETRSSSKARKACSSAPTPNSQARKNSILSLQTPSPLFLSSQKNKTQSNN